MDSLSHVLAVHYPETPPAVNQCSMHVDGHDDAMINFCQKHVITYVGLLA
eukprot:SAG11_NODE_2931_length_2830_cov_2.053094_4_plen_50_part_00